MKICSKCKIEKNLNEFYNTKNVCKKCIKKYIKNNEKKLTIYRKKYNRKYYEKNKKEISKQKGIYYIKNIEKCKEKARKQRENNPEYSLKYQKENKKEIVIYRKKYGLKYRAVNKKQLNILSCKYRKNKANYDTYALQILYAERVRNMDGFLQTKCAYCGKWYFPTQQSINSRIQALNNIGGENRLYCSTECKIACPIYKKQLYQEGHPLKNENSSREVQPELRQMVFERDEYICLKCRKHQDDLDVPLHCHHIEGIKQNPIESADIDMCVTVCKKCHNKIHQQKDCNYFDMRCNYGRK